MRKHKQDKAKLSKKMKQLSTISSSFDCSGSFELSKPFAINLMPKNNNLLLNFPHPSPNQIQKALQYAKKSGFGKQNTNVVDQSYRYAFQYLPDQMGLPSILIERIFSDVIEAIKNSMGCDTNIRAQLIKLNIYPKGGLFKKHVDSPKGDAFGSLVVFLPCYFKGGKLMVENKQIHHQFDYSNNKKENKVNWVAFYNDCIHQITQVLDGCRLNLSYNLFYESLLEVNVEPKLEYLNYLKALPKEKCYGFYCEHFYGSNAFKNYKQKLKNMRFLKGRDYDLYTAAQKIQSKKIYLKVLINQDIKKPSQFKESNPNEASSEQNQQKRQNIQAQGQNERGSSLFQEQIQEQQYNQQNQQNITFFGDPQDIKEPEIAWQDHQGDDEGGKARYFKKLKLKRWKDFAQVQWLNVQNNNSRYKYAISTYYGNDYSVGEHYCQLIMLIYL